MKIANPYGLNQARCDVLNCLQALEPTFHVVILRNWYPHPFSKDPEHPRLFGDVENHPRLGRAQNVTTTSCKYLNETIGIAVTKNTVYILQDKWVQK